MFIGICSIGPLVYKINFRYHEWMKSEELQILTASEPLSLQDEYKMQQTWREDDDSRYTQEVGLRDFSFQIKRMIKKKK